MKNKNIPNLHTLILLGIFIVLIFFFVGWQFGERSATNRIQETHLKYNLLFREVQNIDDNSTEIKEVQLDKYFVKIQDCQAVINQLTQGQGVGG